MKAPVREFVERLASTVPELASILRLHIADEGELLPHVLMGDVTRAMVVASTKQGHADWLPEVLQCIEDGLLSGDQEVAELVGVSFVENLSGESTAIKALLPSMGRMLREEVRLICGV